MNFINLDFAENAFSRDMVLFAYHGNSQHFLLTEDPTLVLDKASNEYGKV